MKNSIKQLIMQIELVIASKFKATAPICKISTSEQTTQVTCGEEINNINLDLDTATNDEIKIEFLNKDDQDDNVIIIKKIKMDGIDLQHFIYQGEFRPVYNQDWFDKQQPKPPLVYRPCTELRHNGVWSIRVSQPIWKMIMNEWIKDDR